MITGDDITVLVPTHPARGEASDRTSMLRRALDSVLRQELPPASIEVVLDADGKGSADTRNEGLPRVDTPWVAFLDSDDELLPSHLRVLAAEADRTGADVIYPGCRVVDGQGRPVQMREEWGRFARPFDPELLRRFSYLPVTSLVRTDLARRAQFGPPGHDLASPYDDWGFYLRLLDLGARFVHLPAITWVWHHHGQNTSGQPTKGDAAQKRGV